jgi:hypothetical protein
MSPIFRGRSRWFRGADQWFRGRSPALRGRAEAFRGTARIFRGIMGTFRGTSEVHPGTRGLFRGTRLSRGGGFGVRSEGPAQAGRQRRSLVVEVRKALPQVDARVPVVVGSPEEELQAGGDTVMDLASRVKALPSSGAESRPRPPQALADQDGGADRQGSAPGDVFGIAVISGRSRSHAEEVRSSGRRCGFLRYSEDSIGWQLLGPKRKGKG